jgi:hypothetical protein
VGGGWGGVVGPGVFLISKDGIPLIFKKLAYLFHFGIEAFLLLPLGRFVWVRFAKTQKSIISRLMQIQQNYGHDTLKFFIGTLTFHENLRNTQTTVPKSK